MSISETASVAPDVATSKRAIQMNWFAGKEDHDEVVAKNSPTFRATAEGSALGDKPFVKVLGQVAGEIFKVDEREGQLRDGTPTKSVIAIGEFEAANYKSGEVIESYTAYLPKYYLETCKLALEAGAKSVPFAIEIVLTPTGKSIPTAYEVRNLIRRRPDSVMNRIKRELAESGRLKLSAPINLTPAQELLEHADAALEPPADETDPPANDTSPQTGDGGSADPSAEPGAEGATAVAGGRGKGAKA